MRSACGRSTWAGPTPDFFANRANAPSPARSATTGSRTTRSTRTTSTGVRLGRRGDGNTNFGYYNADFEAAIAAGDQAATLDEAVIHYQEAEAILAADFPTVPLSFSGRPGVLQRASVQRRARPVQRPDQAAPGGGERRRVTPDVGEMTWHPASGTHGSLHRSPVPPGGATLFLVMLALHLLTTLAIQLNGNPALAFFGDRIPTASQLAAVEARYGLDDPCYDQPATRASGRSSTACGEYLHGDFGTNLRGREVTDIVATAAPNTLRLFGIVTITWLVLGMVLGSVAARWRGRAVDHGDPPDERAHRRVPGVRAAARVPLRVRRAAVQLGRGHVRRGQPARADVPAVVRPRPPVGDRGRARASCSGSPGRRRSSACPRQPARELQRRARAHRPVEGPARAARGHPPRGPQLVGAGGDRRRARPSPTPSAAPSSPRG